MSWWSSWGDVEEKDVLEVAGYDEHHDEHHAHHEYEYA